MAACGVLHIVSGNVLRIRPQRLMYFIRDRLAKK